MTQVVFVTKQDCALCASALPIVRKAARFTGFELSVNDIGDDPAYATHAERLPVVLAEGTVLLEGRIGLTDALAAFAKLRFGRRGGTDG